MCTGHCNKCVPLRVILLSFLQFNGEARIKSKEQKHCILCLWITEQSQLVAQSGGLTYNLPFYADLRALFIPTSQCISVHAHSMQRVCPGHLSISKLWFYCIGKNERDRGGERPKLISLASCPASQPVSQPVSVLRHSKKHRFLGLHSYFYFRTQQKTSTIIFE